MLYTYTNTDQTVATDVALVFNTNGVKTGCTVTHIPGTSAINLNKPGFYMVHFNGDAAEDGTAGDITVQLFGNGVLIPGAEATEDSTAITDIVNMGFDAIVRVCPNCCSIPENVPLTLTFVNTGVGAVFTNAAVTVTKIA